MNAPAAHTSAPQRAIQIANPLTESVKPIVRWAGGKTKLLGDLIARMPSSFRHYVEPFVGGGSLFWKLFGAGDCAQRATIADINLDLIGMYIAIATDPDAVNAELDVFRKSPNGGTGEAVYYGARAAWNEIRGTWSPAKRAATMIYLNRACFNGLWRVNADGAFNVPIGAHKTIGLPTRERLLAASAVLARAEIHCASFQDTLETVGDGDFVYLDSPYMSAPTSQNGGNGGFTSYASGGFGEASHRLLAEAARKAVTRGARVMLSQADVPLAHELYPDFRIEVVEAPRSINSKGSARGCVRELILRGGY